MALIVSLCVCRGEGGGVTIVAILCKLPSILLLIMGERGGPDNHSMLVSNNMFYLRMYLSNVNV